MYAKQGIHELKKNIVVECIVHMHITAECKGNWLNSAAAVYTYENFMLNIAYSNRIGNLHQLIKLCYRYINVL